MRILLAEDNQKLAAIIQRGLSAEHYAVDVFHDGKEAWLMAGGKEYDLLILDWMMPSLDGLTICSRLREAGVVTPVLFLTAKDAIKDRVAGLDVGADDYLVKPFAFEELLARVRALLRRNSSTKQTEIEYHGLVLNPATKQIVRDGQILDLTAKEFAMLAYFMRHPEQVFSVDQLLDHLWNHDYHGMSNIVQANVKNLRQKVDKPFPNKPSLLQTVRGLGYKLQAVS